MTTRKIIVKVDHRPHSAGTDFAALADRLIQESWHLPPDGDQSWREQDAYRIFSEQGEDPVDHGEAPPAEEAEADDTRPEPDFGVPKTFGIVLPLSLATFVTVLAVTFSMPEILTAGFWSNAQTERGPKAAIAPVSMASAAPLMPVGHEAAPGKLRPSLAEDVRPAARPVRLEDKAVVAPVRDQVAQAAPSVVANTMGQTPQKARAKRSRLPPIGEAYFASHAPAASRKVASTEWKIEAARWDETAAKIQARREKYQNSGDVIAAKSRAGDSSEFP